MARYLLRMVKLIFRDNGVGAWLLTFFINLSLIQLVTSIFLTNQRKNRSQVFNFQLLTFWVFIYVNENIMVRPWAVSKSAQDMERILKEERKARRDIESFISHFKVWPLLLSPVISLEIGMDKKIKEANDV